MSAPADADDLGEPRGLWGADPRELPHPWRVAALIALAIVVGVSVTALRG